VCMRRSLTTSSTSLACAMSAANDRRANTATGARTCIYVYIYPCMYVCMYVCIYVCMYVCI
jgi:hypothetical protein